MGKKSKWSKERIEVIKSVEGVESEDEEFIQMLVESDMQQMPAHSILPIAPMLESRLVDTSTVSGESGSSPTKEKSLSEGRKQHPHRRSTKPCMER